MKSPNKFYFFFYLLIFSLSLYSQDDEIPSNYPGHDPKYYFEDGFSNVSNIFKIDFLASAFGDITLSWEHIYTDKNSIEAEIGYLTDPMIPIFPESRFPEDYTEISGYSYAFMWRIYKDNMLPGIVNFGGLKFGQQYYSFDNEQKLKHTDIYVTVAGQYYLFSRYTIEYGLYYGYRWGKIENFTKMGESDYQMLKLSLKLGFLAF